MVDFDAHLPGPRLVTAGEQISGPPGPDRLPAPPGYGFANYNNVFVNRAPVAGNAPLAASETPSADVVEGWADELVGLMDAAGVEVAVLLTESNATAVTAIRRHPKRLKGFAHLSPYDGMRAVRELERLVREEGMSGLDVASLYDQVPASDRRFYPLYAKCVELDVPARIYTAMTYANDRAYELGHPRHLDTVAVDIPELRIVADLSGWPWVNDMVGLLRRHPNLYSSTGGHRPRHFATPGSGWEQFLQFGNTLLQDKVIVGLSSKTLNMSMSDVIAEYGDLPLKDSVKAKWLHGNAARLFGLGA